MDKVKTIPRLHICAFHCGLNYTQRNGKNYTDKSMYCDHDETAEPVSCPSELYSY